MKNKETCKRIGALLMSGIIAVSSVPVNVFAEESKTEAITAEDSAKNVEPESVEAEPAQVNAEVDANIDANDANTDANVVENSQDNAYDSEVVNDETENATKADLNESSNESAETNSSDNSESVVFDDGSEASDTAAESPEENKNIQYTLSVNPQTEGGSIVLNKDTKSEKTIRKETLTDGIQYVDVYDENGSLIYSQQVNESNYKYEYTVDEDASIPVFVVSDKSTENGSYYELSWIKVYNEDGSLDDIGYDQNHGYASEFQNNLVMNSNKTLEVEFTQSSYDTETETNENAHTEGETDFETESNNENKIYEYTYEDDYVLVTASANTESGIPENAELHADKVEGDKYEDAFSIVKEFVETGSNNVVVSYRPVDVYFTVDGEKIEPENGTVNVSISYKENTVVDESNSETNTAQQVVHIKDNGEIETLENNSDEQNKLVFNVSSFSIMGDIMLVDSNDADETPCLILYSNGEAIFQKGTTTDESKGKVLYWIYDVEKKTLDRANYYSLFGSSQNEVASITFSATIQPKSACGWFRNCNNLTTINGIENLDLSNSTSTYSMFDNCSKLKNLNVSNFNTSNVTDMSYMFEGCSSLTELDISNFDTSKVTSFNCMFKECKNVANLDVSKWNTENVTNTNLMFYDCKSLKEVNFSHSNLSNVSNMTGMFSGCTSIDSIYLSSSGEINPSIMRSMFYNCSNLKNLDISQLRTDNVSDLSNIFCGCSSLTSIDVSEWDTSNATTIGWMFMNCSSLKEIIGIENFQTGKSTTLYSIFSGCSSLKKLDLTKWNVSNVAETNFAFSNCASLTELDLSTWNTSNIKTMQNMFTGCKNLKNLNVTGWDTVNVTTMYEIFKNCQSLKELDMSSFNTSNTKNNTTSFLDGCTSLCKISFGSNTYLNTMNSLPSPNWLQKSTGKTVSSTDIVKTYSSSPSEDTFYRVATITFNANGGSKTQTIEQAYEIKNTTFSSSLVKEPTKKGYIFAGWYTRKADGDKLSDGDIMVETTYYAHWTPIEYTLILKSSGAGQPDINVKLSYAEYYQLSDDVFTYDGYVLSGWNTRRNGSGTSYKTSEYVGKLTAEDGDKIILYAQWTPEDEYAVITFDTNGGNEINKKRIKKNEVIENLQTPQKDGYTFINWHYAITKGDGTIDYDNFGDIVTNTTVFTENTTLIAEWKKNPIVTLVTGLDGYKDITIEVGYNKKIGELPAYATSDSRFSEFTGWFTEDGFNNGTQITKNTVFTKDTTLYAHWGWKPTFDTNGGKFTDSVANNYKIQENSEYTITELPAVIRDGYIFNGWYLNNGTKVEAGNVVDLSNGNIITASWSKVKTHTITLNLNGGSYSYDTTIKINDGNTITGVYSPNRYGYTFLGWADKNGYYHTNGEEINADLILTAQWQKNDMTVTFNPGSGSIYYSSKTVSVPFGTTLNRLPGARLTNYILEGWYAEENGKGEKLTTETIINDNITYYAYYIPTTESITDDNFTYTFGAEWSNASNADVDNQGDTLDFHPAGTNQQTASLHLRFEINKAIGDDVLETGTVKIKIPKSVWKDWDGNDTGSNNLSVNLPKYPNIRSGMYFSYYEEDGCYILINNQGLSGGTGLDVTISYTVSPLNIAGGATDINGNYVDEYNYYSQTVPINVSIDKDKDGNADMANSKDLYLEMHTKVTPHASMSYYNKYSKWDSSWGEEPTDSDEYFYISWKVNGSFNYNQQFDYNWSLDTAHDGTFVCFANKESGSTTYSNTNYVIMKYPVSMLKDMTEEGITITNQAVLNTDWKSGYEQKQAVKASIKLYPEKSDDGDFGKTNTSSSVITKTGAQDSLVYNDNSVSLRWNLVYDGAAHDTVLSWNSDLENYSADYRTIEITDGNSGDIMYSSGSASEKYIWNPDTGNEALLDEDYNITSLSIYLTEYDIKKDGNVWSSVFKHSDASDYDSVDVYVRYKNTKDYVYYKSVNVTSAGTQYKIQMPSDVNGYKLVHKTDYASTNLGCYVDVNIKPASHLLSLLKTDMSAGVTSIIKNQSTCKIYNTETNNVFFEASNNDGNSRNAHNVIYELTKGHTYQKTYKSAASQDYVIFDADEGTQDNPVYISGWNYSSTNSSDRIPMKSGVFYDLLPVGTSVDESTIFGIPVTTNDSNASDLSKYYSYYKNSSSKLSTSLYNVEFKENWENSGRIMMIITWSAPSNTKVTGMQFWYLLHNTYNNIVRNGTSLENDIALVNTTEGASIPEYKSDSQSIITESKYFDSLQTDYEDFITYAKGTTNYVPVAAFSWGFDKSVSTNNMDYSREIEVLPGDDYIYKLTYNQSASATSSNIKFFDVLEAGTDTCESSWYGTFKNIDVNTITSQTTEGSTTVHCKPVIYYSTKDRKLFTAQDYDLTNNDTWTTTKPEDNSTITAIGVDCSKNDDGTDFVMKGLISISVYITMTAPDDETAYGKLSANRGVISSIRNEDKNETTMESTAKTTLKNVDPEIHKTSDPESGTKDEPAEIFEDTILSYKLKVSNTDERVTLHNIVLEDTIDDLLLIDHQNITVNFGDGKEVDINNSPRITMEKTKNKVVFTINSLIAGESAEITIPTLVNVTSGVIENTAKITGVNGNERSLESETVYHEVKEYKKFDLTIKKINKEKEFLKGATLRLTGRGIYDSKDITPIEWTTEEEDKVITLAPGDYVLEELDSPDGYAISDSINIHLAKDMTVTMVDVEETVLTVTKRWNDNNDISKIRPESIEFELYRDGKYLKDITVTKENNWTATIAKLQKIDAKDFSHVYKYTVKEKDINNYTAEYSVSAEGDGYKNISVTNTLVDSISGTKTWNDNDNANDIRPESITVKLFKNGVLYDTTTTSAVTNWEYNFYNLPKYDKDGSLYEYTIKEDYVKGYSASYQDNRTKGLAITIDCETEGLSWDWIYLYYYYNGALYRTGKYGGKSRTQTTIAIPSSEFWIEFRTDGSGDTYYGLKVTSASKLEYSPEPTGEKVNAFEGGYKAIDVESPTDIETAHNPYANNARARWHYAGGNGYNITNTKVDEDSTSVQIQKIDDEGNSVIGAKLQILDSKDEIIHEWYTEDTSEQFDGIEPGIYTLHEVSAPDGYIIADDMEIEILDTTDPQTFTMIDRQYKTIKWKLPDTGSNTLKILFGSTSATLFISILIRKKKRS